MPVISSQGGFVSLGYDFILNKMPKANGTYVKIYLYLLAKAGGNVEYSEIASALSVLESDVVNAVEYWRKEGVVSISDGTLCLSAEAPALAEDTPQQVYTAPPETETVKKTDYTTKQVSDAVLASPALRDMMAVAEELLGKPLNPSEMESLYWFYDGLGFSPEAILMLLEYCVARGKPRISYAEKVALSWKERGLVTSEDISRFLRDSERRLDAQKQIMDAMGIGGRPAAAGEEQYFSKWLGEYAMSVEMVLLAHEYCLMQTNKLSFPYMDKILERWNAAGIRTAAAAQAEHNSFRAKKNKPDAGNDGYGHMDLEQLLRGK